MSIIGEWFRIPSDKWFDEAVCAEIGDWDLWFPENGESSKTARRVCVWSCPVRAECLKYAFDNNERYGIFGGFTERDREKLRRGESPFRGPGRPARRPNGHGFACKCVVCRRAA